MVGPDRPLRPAGAGGAPPGPAPELAPLRSSQVAPASGRVLAVDVLRGFVMFCILGGDELVHAFNAVFHTRFTRALAAQLDHAAWQGLTFYDLIFPTFVFIVGISVVFSLGKLVERQGRGAALKRLLLRSLALYALGVIYYGGFARQVGDIRLLGVLQRIALCYLFTGLLFLTLKLRGLVIACLVLLVGYWAALTFIPVPGFGAGQLAEGRNLANYIDREYLPLFKWDGDHDPEGLLSTLPAIATCLLGLFTGLLLRKASVTDQQKVYWLVGGGAIALLAGYAWAWHFPIIKKIWTSSYVLVAGGYSALMLAGLMQLTEVWHRRAWARPLEWIGANAITLYLAYAFIDFHGLSDRLVGGPVEARLGRYGALLGLAVTIGLVLLLARFLCNRKIYLKI
jgi:predicted acyltransferase